MRRKLETTAIVVAAGVGRRLGRGGDKAFRNLGGRPLLYYSIRALEDSPEIDRVVVVVRESVVRKTMSLARRFDFRKVEAVVAGGKERQDSVRNGFRFVGASEYVLIHDAARPFLSRSLISRTLRACRRAGAAVAALPVADTLKKVRGGHVEKTVSREALWFAQTPQAFRRRLLEQALKRWSTKTTVTDDASLVERLGKRVTIVRGDSLNIKVTYPADVLLAESMLKLRHRRPA